MNWFGRRLQTSAWAALACVASVMAPRSAEIPQDSHKWDRLIYGQSFSDTDSNFWATVVQRPSGLGIQVDAFGLKDPKQAGVGIRLINELGQWFDPVESNPLGSVGQAGKGPDRSLPWTYVANFKWPENAVEAAWIELVIDTRYAYLELPYGFFRDPSNPLPEFENPEKPARKQSFVEDALAGSWDLVIYRVGKIQNDWQLSVKCHRYGGDRVELVLYKEDVILGQSNKHWRLDEPSTSIHVEEEGVLVLRAELIDQRIHQDNMRRSDVYRWPASASTDRTWGTLKIKVADSVYECIVPSSVYRD